MTTLFTGRAGPAQKSCSTLIELRGVEKVYRSGKLEFAALRGVRVQLSTVAP